MAQESSWAAHTDGASFFGEIHHTQISLLEQHVSLTLRTWNFVPLPIGWPPANAGKRMARGCPFARRGTGHVCGSRHMGVESGGGGAGVSIEFARLVNDA